MSDIDRRSAFVAFGLLATAGLLPPAAASRAQQRGAAAAFPTRPVHLLVGYPAGGGSDLMARPLAQKLSERWGQQVVVENRPGVNGNLAVEAVARAAPDGYTLLLANMAQLVTNPAVYRNLPVDTLRDLAPVAQIVEAVQVVVVSATVPARTLTEFIALARQAPGRFNMGSSGNGGLSHLALELLKRRAGVDIVHVPYRGSAPALQDLLAGNIQLMIDPYAPFLGRAEAGLVRVLAVTSLERIPALPDVPTLSETPGLEGFEATGFVGVVAPAATPRPVVAQLEEAVAWAIREPDLEQTYVAQGQTPRFADAAAFRDRITRGHETWGRVAREANITVD
jgi:tripartite-type tricarboxylate transporter receptor subunit TctC